MRFTHIDINFWHHIWWSPKTLKMGIESVFEGFQWPSYVTSKIDVNVCEPHYVNLFFLWTSSIVYVFDFLTFDIFLIIWHLFDNLTSFWHFDFSFNLNHLSPSQGYFFKKFLRVRSLSYGRSKNLPFLGRQTNRRFTPWRVDNFDAMSFGNL